MRPWTPRRLTLPTLGATALRLEVLVPLADFEPHEPYDSNELVSLGETVQGQHACDPQTDLLTQDSLKRTTIEPATRPSENAYSRFWLGSLVKVAAISTTPNLFASVSASPMRSSATHWLETRFTVTQHRLVGTRKHNTFVQLGEQVGAV